jgi:hypothetical protein
MKTVYELWDAESANLVGSYETQEEALAVVRGAVAAYGPWATRTLALVAEEGLEHSRTLASGDELGALAASSSSDLVIAER